MQSKGEFWHLTILNGALVVAQDEIDTYTVHRMIPPGVDFEMGNPVDFVKESLGGLGGPLDIEIDNVIVHGRWQGDLAVADAFRSAKGRVFLAGDSGLYPFSFPRQPIGYKLILKSQHINSHQPVDTVSIQESKTPTT